MADRFFLEKYNLEMYALDRTANRGNQIVMYIGESYIYANNTQEVFRDFIEFKIIPIEL